MKKVVVIGGGTGVFTVLSGLKNKPYSLSAILTMADDGGSSGLLREEFGVLPPGDIRRALLALSPSSSSMLSKLFNYRFKGQSALKGHSFGNLFITALEKITGSFSKAVDEAAKILGVKGKIIPVTLESTRLFARLENGLLVVGETNIDIPKHDGILKIKELFLNPSVKANPKAITAIKEADLIVMGPGDLYSSLLPTLLVQGISKAILKSKAKKIYFCNIMTKYGETNNYTPKVFLNILEKYLTKNILDYLVINVTKPNHEYLKKYIKEKKNFISFDAAEFIGYKVEDLSKKVIISKKSKTIILLARLLRSGSLLRHDPDKLADVIDKITF